MTPPPDYVNESDITRTVCFNMGENATSPGSIYLVDGPIKTGTPEDGVLIFLFTDDIEGTLEKVKENGGRVVDEVGPQGAFGLKAHFVDSEGQLY